MRKKATKQTEEKKPYQFPINERAFDTQRRTGEITLINIGDTESYEHLGINANDMLMIKQTQENDESQLSFWLILNTINCQMGFAFDNFGDISIHDGKGNFRRYKKKAVRMIGVVVGVVKPFGVQTSVEAAEESDAGAKDEITLTCSKCGKEMTGTKKFLRAQGWEIKGDNSLCVKCDLLDW